METIKQDLEHQGKKLIEHEYAIKQISTSIKELSESSKESNKKLGVIADNMIQQKLIFERLNNIETNYKEGIGRVHKRINQVEDEIKEIHKLEDTTGCKAFQLAEEKMNTRLAELNSNVKSNQHRVDELDNIKDWLVKIIIGTLLTGSIGLLFYIKH